MLEDQTIDALSERNTPNGTNEVQAERARAVAVTQRVEPNGRRKAASFIAQVCAPTTTEEIIVKFIAMTLASLSMLASSVAQADPKSA